ncbi:anti-sigma factor antagonist [Mycolicibacterium anyangense]|uniref:Anti-sigma factor antagonist n=1 Tax=Mycolicibacterium anyangense TaxID=1431246 RepID=A0A6N4WG12_9MYCO|nr:anti-sigma factor antagonist [Mycolicibacterium anyangense]
MNLTVTLDTPHSARLIVAGELDFVAAPQLLATASQVLRENDSLGHLHLDFADLTLCDSAGLATLVLIERRCTESRVRLHLDRTTRQLERILDVTGLREHFAAAASAQPEPRADGNQDETVG